MKYIEAPDEFDGRSPAVFLAGGITGTDNWQASVAQSLRHTELTVLNPRRRHFPVDDQAAGLQQIEWEHRHLQRATLAAFWFPPPTLCPIALFELGACCSAGLPLVVGADRQYSRRFDLIVQLGLRRPEVGLVDSLEALSAQIGTHPALQGLAP
jgi:hypothetical protein